MCAAAAALEILIDSGAADEPPRARAGREVVPGGVWAICGDVVGNSGQNVLASVLKDWDDAVYTAVGAFVAGTLPTGRDVVLGLDGYHVRPDRDRRFQRGSPRRSSASARTFAHSASSSIARPSRRRGERAARESPRRSLAISLVAAFLLARRHEDIAGRAGGGCPAEIQRPRVP